MKDGVAKEGIRDGRGRDGSICEPQKVKEGGGRNYKRQTSKPTRSVMIFSILCHIQLSMVCIASTKKVQQRKNKAQTRKRETIGMTGKPKKVHIRVLPLALNQKTSQKNGAR